MNKREDHCTLMNESTVSFYDKLEELRKDDPFSPTGKESDRTFSHRLGFSHRCIKLYREGQIPDLVTLSKIKANANLSEDDFIELAYAALGVRYETHKLVVPVYDINGTTYIDSRFNGEPIRMLDPKQFNKPVSVIRAAYRAIEVDPGNPFCEARLPFYRWVFVFNINKVDPVSNELYIFHDREGRLYIGRLIIRGRQMWISEGNDDAANKVTLDIFNRRVVGQVVDVKPYYDE